MHSGTRNIFGSAAASPKRFRSNGDREKNAACSESAAQLRSGKPVGAKARVFVAAENRLMREALSRMLTKSGEIEVVGTDIAESFRTEDLLKKETDILLLSSRGNGNEDLTAVRKVRTNAPKVQILLIGVTGEEAEFLQCVRAGVHGYLPRDVSADDVVDGVRAIQLGKAICPGTLCATLFRYFEQEATSFPSASARPAAGIDAARTAVDSTDRRGTHEQGNRQSLLSLRATVKNHRYRMKHKIGAEDRLGIVQVCRTQGFMV